MHEHLAFDGELAAKRWKARHVSVEVVHVGDRVSLFPRPHPSYVLELLVHRTKYQVLLSPALERRVLRSSTQRFALEAPKEGLSGRV